MGKPHVAADHRTFADYGIAAEDRRPRINNDVVFDIGVAFYAFHGVAVAVELKTFCTQRYALVNFYVPADGTGLADDHSRTVIDEKVFADVRARVDVDSRRAVRLFRHNTGQERNMPLIKRMRQPVDTHRFKTGVRQKYLLV